MPVVLALPLLLGPGVLACLKGGYFDGPRLGPAIAAWSLPPLPPVAPPRGRVPRPPGRDRRARRPAGAAPAGAAAAARDRRRLPVRARRSAVDPRPRAGRG